MRLTPNTFHMPLDRKQQAVARTLADGHQIDALSYRGCV